MDVKDVMLKHSENKIFDPSRKEWTLVIVQWTMWTGFAASVAFVTNDP